MPTKRRRLAGAVRRIDISPAALDAWRSGDYWGVWRELHLKLWQMPDWNADEVEADDRPRLMRQAHPAPDPRALKTALLELAGPPGRWWFNEGERDADEA